VGKTLDQFAKDLNDNRKEYVQIAQLLRQEELNFHVKMHQKQQLDKRHQRAVQQLQQAQDTID